MPTTLNQWRAVQPLRHHRVIDRNSYRRIKVDECDRKKIIQVRYHKQCLYLHSCIMNIDY